MIEEGLKIKIGGDIVEVTKSITELEQEFKDLSQTLKTQTGQAFVDTNKKLDKLAETIKTVKNIGRTGFNEFGEQIDGVGRSVGRAGQAAQGAVPALNSLGQVARDLPFGFIAIQNNLPIVVDQFGALTKSSGGVGGALRALGSSLLGPAGIAFAFGAITAGVTSLIQKYGSLGAAADALLSGTKQLSKAQKEVADGIGDELGEIALLVNIYPQLQGNREQQEDILKKLNKISPEYFKNLSAEKTSIEELGKSYDKYLNSLVGKAFIEANLELIKEEAKKAAAEIVKLQQRQQETEAKARKGTQSLKQFVDQADRLSKINKGGDIQLQVGVQVAPKSFDEAKQSIFDKFNQFVKTQLAGGANFLQGFDFGNDKTGDQAAKDALAKRRQELTSLKGALEAELQSTGSLTDRYKDLQIAIAQVGAEIQKLGVTSPEAIKNIDTQLQLTLAGISESFKNNRAAAGSIDFVPILNLDEDEARKRWLDLYAKLQEIGTEEATKTQGKVSGKIQIIPSQLVQDNIGNLNVIKNKVAEVSAAFGQTLAPAIDSAFQALEQGQNIIQSVGNFFKRLTIQIAASIVKAAILAAILNGITGGGAAAAGAAGGVGGFGKIFTGLLGIGKTAAPGGASIGAGLSFGGVALPSFSTPSAGAIQVQISGQFGLRGPDLVASINNTNATIGRVG